MKNIKNEKTKLNQVKLKDDFKVKILIIQIDKQKIDIFDELIIYFIIILVLYIILIYECFQKYLDK